MRTKASRHSHILVPDGLTARLMRTTRIRPWPIGTVWSPANLFPGPNDGQGLALDFSDISTLYTDQKFATNISAIGDPVGGVLDKSKGLVLGAEKLTNGGFDTDLTGWTAAAGFSVSGGKLIGATSGDKIYQAAGITAGEVYSFTITGVVGEWGVRLGQDAANDYTITADGTYFITPGTLYSTTDFRLRVNIAGSELASISVKKLSGNHLIQPTSTARPIWTRHPKSGVRNLLDDSEDLLSGWSLAGQTVVWDAAENAWNITISGANITCPQRTLSLSSDTYTTTFEIKGTAGETINTRAGANPEVLHTFTGGWDTVTFTRTAAYDRINLSTWGGATARQFYFRHAQIEVGATATAYQTRVSKYDVTEAGVADCYGLTFDGVDDYMVTAANLDLSGTTDITVCAGVFAENDSKYFGVGMGAASTDVGFRLGYHNHVTQIRMSKFSTAGDIAAVFTSTGRPASAVLTGFESGADRTLRGNGAELASNTTIRVNSMGSGLLYLPSETTPRGAGTIYGVTLTDYILDAEQLAALEAWTAARTPEVTLAVPSDFYVDSVSGSDSNSGKFDDAAFQTLAAAETAALTYGDGANVFLLAGSEWEEQLDISEGSSKVLTFGAGGAPVIDATKEITGTWTQPDAGTYANVWSISWSRANASPTSTELLHYWEDGAKPRLASDLADLQANGGWYTNNRIAGTSTIYIKAASDPNSDGAVREASYLEHCILYANGDNGSGAENVTITGPLELRGAVGHYGCLAAETGTASKLLLRDGTLHHVVTAGNLEDVICTGMPQSLGTQYIPVTFYQADPAGRDVSGKRLVLIGDDGNTASQGIYNHGSGTEFGTMTLEQIAITDTYDGINHASPNVVLNGIYTERVSNSTFIQATSGTYKNLQINKPRSFGSTARNVLTGSGIVSDTARDILIENAVIYADEAFLSPLIRWQRNGTLTIRNCSIIMAWTGAKRLALQLGDGGGATPACTVNLTDNVIVAYGAPIVGVGEYLIRVNDDATCTLNSDRNIFIGNSGIDYRKGATTLGTFALWQGAGYDANSVFFEESDLATIKSTYFQGDPATGDFRLADLSGLGTFGDGSALNNAGAQTHWDWNARAQASGAPTAWPTLPATLTDQRAYIADPTAWSF